MKKVHHATRRAIIRRHEKTHQICVTINGKAYVIVTLWELRQMNAMYGCPAFRIDVGGEPWRALPHGVEIKTEDLG